MKQILLTILSLTLLYAGLGSCAAAIKYAAKAFLFITKKILSK